MSIVAQLQNVAPLDVAWPIATVITAFSVFPSPPKAYIDFVRKHEILHWLAVFVLAMQGGSKFNVQSAALTTAGIYLAFKVIEYLTEARSTKA